MPIGTHSSESNFSMYCHHHHFLFIFYKFTRTITMAETGTSSAAQENVAELQLGPSFQVRSKTLVEKHCTPSFERSQQHDSHYTLFSF